MTDMAWTKDRQILIPEVLIDELPPGAYIEPLRGNKYTVAVMMEDECIGWALSEPKAESL